MAVTTTKAMKRLNRLRKLATGKDLFDYAGTNLNQNWKAIEDTFSSVWKLLSDTDQSISDLSREFSDAISGIVLPASAVSGSSGLFATTSSTYVQPTNLSTSLLVKKTNVKVSLIPSGDTVTMAVLLGGGFAIRVLRDGSQVAEFQFASSQYANNIMYVDRGVPAGTRSYAIQVKRDSGSGNLIVYNYSLVVEELP